MKERGKNHTKRLGNYWSKEETLNKKGRVEICMVNQIYSYFFFNKDLY